jgi:hypothetical protein
VGEAASEHGIGPLRDWPIDGLNLFVDPHARRLIGPELCVATLIQTLGERHHLHRDTRAKERLGQAVSGEGNRPNPFGHLVTDRLADTVGICPELGSLAVHKRRCRQPDHVTEPAVQHQDEDGPARV